MSETKTLEAKCFCGAFHANFDVPISALPLDAYLCHCSRCRYATGGLCTFHAASLPIDVRPQFIAPSSEKNITAYHMEGVGYTLNFCSTCGCHIAGIGIEDGGWTPSTSIISSMGPDIVQVKSHVFSKSGKDGGLSKLLREIRGNPVRHWNPPDEDTSAAIIQNKPEIGVDGQERLRAQCHCGGVSFTVARPQQSHLENEELANRYVSPLDKRKWIGILDTCDDCRLTTGTQAVTWTFVPLSAIEPSIGPDLAHGTLKIFKSSKDVDRAFCQDCGATVFYRHNSRLHGGESVVDIATGILRAPEGAMAEDWITWRTRIAHLNDGMKYDEGVTQAFVDGITEWSIEKYGKPLLMQDI